MIAILLATYNGAAYIEEMLDSLERQTHKDFVCYIHDDGSVDDTVTIVSDWTKRHKEENRFKLLEHEPCGGSKENFLWMLAQIDADYYMFADQDDVWVPHKIQKTLELFVEVKLPQAVFSDMFVTDADLNIIEASFIKSIGRDPFDLRLERIIIDNPAAGCTMMINRELRDMAIRLSDTSLIEMHDGFILALAAATGRVHFINESLVYYRQHGHNVMGADTKGTGKRIDENIKSVAKGTFLSKKKEYHMHEVRLSRAILSVANIEDIRVKRFLNGLAGINKKNKLKRISFYKKHRINRAKGNLWFYLWV